jgi:hypothetical protein
MYVCMSNTLLNIIIFNVYPASLVSRTFNSFVYIYQSTKVSIKADIQYGGYSLPNIQPLKLDNAYFGSTKRMYKNLTVDWYKAFLLSRFDKMEAVNAQLR